MFYRNFRTLSNMYSYNSQNKCKASSYSENPVSKFLETSSVVNHPNFVHVVLHWGKIVVQWTSILLNKSLIFFLRVKTEG